MHAHKHFAATLLLAAAATPSLTAQVDRDQAAPVEIRKLYQATYGEILSLAIEGFRVDNIEVIPTDPLRFNATAVRNEGVYERLWTLYFDKTYDELAQSLIANNRRPVDIERYEINGQERFAALAFKNVGAAQKTWNWFRSVPSGQILSTVQAVNGRAIDIEPYSTGQGTRFSVVSIRNTGADAKSWWVYSNTTSGAVQNHMDTHGTRLYDIERYGSLLASRTAAILVRDSVPSTTLWVQSWHGNYDDDEILMGRITSLENMSINSWAVTLVDNLDPFESYGYPKLGTHGFTRHTAAGTAMTGTDIEFKVRNLWPWAPAAFSLGFSRVDIPLDLSGAPGCRLYVAPAFSLSLFANADGRAALDLLVPVDPALHAMKVQTQMYGVDPGLNALNVQTSNGLETTLRHW